ncbi:MAG: 6-hydroxymethylpterin diphosphokinase MptE-like protein [Halobacteriaceae archaeon]
MEFTDWEPAYEAILADLGYDRAADERARDVLAAHAEPFDLGRLDVRGRTVAVAGAGASLEDDLPVAADADAVFAASAAAERLRRAGVDVTCMVTDLDGAPATARALTREGTPVAVHAHGDNVPALREHVPALERSAMLATTQAEPVDAVVNTGGFTDGDRAAFLADHCGAAALCFPGWDLDDPDVGGEKARKLRWAARLLRWLERRRGEAFALLDGRRDHLDLEWQPPRPRE